jgi:hypothetical protein
MEGLVDKINSFFCGVEVSPKNLKKEKFRCENNVIFGIFNL